MLRKYLLFPDAAGGGGSDDMTASVMSEINALGGTPGSPAPPAPAAAPEPAKAPEPKPEPPKPAPASKPDPKSTPPPASPKASEPAAKPDAKAPAPAPAAKAEPVLDWKSAPTQFRTAHEALLAKSRDTQEQLERKIAEATTRISDYEKRTYLTPAQQERVKTLEESVGKMTAELYARNYEESPEFKQKFTAKGEATYERVKNNLAGVKIRDGETERDATVADFNKIRQGRSEREMRSIAKGIFGEDADIFFGFAKELNDLEQGARLEIKAKRDNWQAERQKMTEEETARATEVGTRYTSADQELATKFSGKLGPMEGNDEFNKALGEGLAYVDKIMGGDNQKKTPAELAFNGALGRRLAGAWFASQILVKQKDARIAELEAQISGIQRSDPGNAGELGGAGTAPASDASGTDAMIDEIESQIKGA